MPLTDSTVAAIDEQLKDDPDFAAVVDAELRAMRIAQKLVALAEDLVFGNRKGAPMRESKILTEVLQPAAVKAGLGRVTWHQFRHIHSSRLNDLRVPVKIAQEQLGHASIATTLNIYTHVVDASHRKAIEALERELFPSVPKSEDRLEDAIPVSDSVN
jgi:integrase